MTVAPLDALFRRVNEGHLAATLPPGSAGYEGRLSFAMARLEEGRKTHDHLARRYPDALAPGARVLDVGCGNGGLLLPFAEAGHPSWALDIELHPELSEVAGGLDLSLCHLQGRGEHLPWPDATFDVVLLTETLEHVPAPRRLGAEVARVLRPGGICYVTTPPRLRFLLSGDPHYDIPGLLLLPDALQRLAFERVLARGEEYGVTHVFWSVAGILRCLPGLEPVEITSKNWAGALRRLDWDWVVARKPSARPAQPPPAPDPVTPAAFWDRESGEPRSGWMELPAVRRYVNRQVTGDPDAWPLDWFRRFLGDRTFDRALSVGCGSGHFERHLVSLGICSRVDAFDLSISSLARARRQAREEGLEGIRYFAADFNRPALPRRRYDAVFFHQSLHHVARLETLLRHVLRTLEPGGLLFLDEFVGPSRHEWTEERVARYQPLYERVPPEARWFDYMPFPIQWDDLSEAVRSGDILAQLRVGFRIEELRGYGGNVLAVLYPALVRRKVTDAMVDWMLEEDRAAVAAGEPPFHAVVVARPTTGLAASIAAARYWLEPKLKRLGREIATRLKPARPRITRPRRLLHPPEYDRE